MKSLTLFLALLCVAALAQTPRKVVAVYMAGKEPATVKGAYKVLGSELAKTITKSKEYTAADRSEAGRKIVASEQIFQRSGAVDPKQIKKLGKQLSVDIVCIAEITEVAIGANKSHYLEARLVDVETSEIFNSATKMSNIMNGSDIVRTADAVAYELVNGERKIVNYSFREMEYNPDGAIEDYTDAIRQKPDEAEYYYKRSYAYLQKGKGDEFFRDIAEAIRLDPNVDSYYFLRAYVNQSYTWEDSKDDEVIADYTEVIRLNPNELDAYNNRGTAYSNKGDHDRAIYDYTQAIRLNPNNAEIYSNRGNAYSGKGDHDRAISDYNEAIRLNPNFVKVYNNRGYAYFEKGDYDKAISNWESALRIDPNDAKAKKNLELIKMLTEKQSSNASSNNDAEAYNNRGNAYYEKGDYDRAIAEYTEAIRLDPNFAEAYNNRGSVYGVKGDLDRAISDFSQAIRLNPNYAEAYNNRGMAYYGKRDYVKTAEDWAATLRIDPNHSDARKNLEIVRRMMEEAQSGGASGNTLTDSRDGKKYKIVKIGSQTWMAENLNYEASGSKCYDNNSGNCAKYGRLYDWNTARSVCPSGWHLPSKSEWDMLSNAVGGEDVAGKKLKAKSGWNSLDGTNGNGTNDYGFSALPGGGGSGIPNGSFGNVGLLGHWWSISEYGSSSAYRKGMGWGDGSGGGENSKSQLFSVRCMMGEAQSGVPSSGGGVSPAQEKTASPPATNTKACETEINKAKAILDKCKKIGKGKKGYDECAKEYKAQQTKGQQSCKR